MGGDLLLLPESSSSVDDGFQPFDGRLGKLRYLSLALMVATSPVSKEVVQLCMSFPAEVDPFDFETSENSSIERIPVAYPILCSHVLTHTTGALIAVAGRARAEEGKFSIESIVDDCRNFIQLGLIARFSQAILARLRSNFGADPAWEQQVYSMLQSSAFVYPGEDEAMRFAVRLLCILLASSNSEASSAPSHREAGMISSQILQAIEEALVDATAFLQDLALICQVLIPNIFSLASHESARGGNPTIMFKSYLELFCIGNIGSALESHLLQTVILSWYADATGKKTNMLDFPRIFRGTTWPVASSTEDNRMTPSSSPIPPNCLPLFGNASSMKGNTNDSSPRIIYLPKSYTDLYAQLSEMCPDSEQTALCLVCGQVSYLKLCSLNFTTWFILRLI